MASRELNILFEQLGLNDKEAQTFLKLLQLGAKPVSVVAKHVGLPRSSTYFTLDKLKEVQLIEEFERSGVKYVRCIPVAQIADVLKKKEMKVHQAMHALEDQMKELQSMENKLSVTPTIRFMEGKDSVLRMYLAEQNQLNKEWYTMYNPATVKDIVPDMLHPKTYVGDKGSSHELLVDCPEAREMINAFRGDKRMMIKLLPKHVSFESDISVTEDYIYMVSLKGDQEAAGVSIVHPQLAAQMKAMMELLWDMLPEPPKQ
ncbi:MAG TPA: helix-turn-helix domain-containing protein [Candidatus Peribacteraceae bacterium]|nr:helix-turn-helix domain-containing protein [Candidatus Peribacteraceae bacterium]